MFLLPLAREGIHHPDCVPGDRPVPPRSGSHALALACQGQTLGLHIAVILQDGKHVHTSVEEYDVGGDRWVTMAAHLPCERKYHTACELNGKLPLLLSPASQDPQHQLSLLVTSGTVWVWRALLI